ncbi:hypothetical protein CLOM_g3271 [Closterium sp. NIES-68]|nr:hypothetical protein CLOM_g3271 [Closterium sp. NIES-68]
MNSVKDRDWRRTARLSDSALASLDLSEGVNKGSQGEVTRVLAKKVVASTSEAVWQAHSDKIELGKAARSGNSIGKSKRPAEAEAGVE